MISIISIVVLLIVCTVSIEGQSATNCGSGNHIQLNSFQLRPHPIKVPSGSATNPVTFNLLTQVTQNLVEPVKVDVTLETRVLFLWIKAPCTNGVGSCSYARLCDFCKTCACSYPTGTHQLDLVMNITSAVPKGSYRARMDFLSATGQRGCVSVTGIVLN